MNPDAIQSFRIAAQRLVDEHFGESHRGAKIIVRMLCCRVTVSIHERVEPDYAETDAPLSMTQQAILEVFADHSGEVMVGTELAKLAGYPPTSGAWKRALAELTRAGRIENCRPGYRLVTPRPNGIAPSANGHSNGTH